MGVFPDFSKLRGGGEGKWYSGARLLSSYFCSFARRKNQSALILRTGVTKVSLLGLAGDIQSICASQVGSLQLREPRSAAGLVQPRVWPSTSQWKISFWIHLLDAAELVRDRHTNWNGIGLILRRAVMDRQAWMFESAWSGECIVSFFKSDTEGPVRRLLGEHGNWLRIISWTSLTVSSTTRP